MTVSDGHLTADQVRKFHTDGYLVIPGFFEAASLLEHAKRVVESFDPSTHPLTKFSTGDTSETEHVGDEYFLSSGTKVSYFLEERALDECGRLVRAKDSAVNKVGHALHQLDPVFRQFSFAPRIQAVSRSLNIHTEPVVLQSMIICKQPSIGGAVPPHNDSTFLYTDPPTALGMWFALEDCDSNNGCLSFLPGSHLDSNGRARSINRRFVRRDPHNIHAGTTFETISPNLDQEATWDESSARLEECKAGSLVLIHGSVLHKSEKNLSEKSRFIYTFHLIEGDPNAAHYDNKNWLQPTKEMPFPKLYHHLNTDSQQI